MNYDHKYNYKKILSEDEKSQDYSMSKFSTDYELIVQ